MDVANQMYLPIVTAVFLLWGTGRVSRNKSAVWHFSAAAAFMASPASSAWGFLPGLGVSVLLTLVLTLAGEKLIA